jgi:putative acetyltransferase
MEAVQLKVVHHTSEDLKGLITKLDEELYLKYPAEEVHVVDFTDAKVNEIVFVVAYINEMPVGCGAIRPFDDEATELKRFYVEVSYRQKGIAKRMLDFLEGQAKAQGFKVMKLETGAEQPEAVNFYVKHGFYAIDKFGEYVDCVSSLCYEKAVGVILE